jgi:uncharacterized metal-binding protein YceD (DUF177 family)
MKKKANVIQFGGLAIGTHVFELEVNDEFFEELEFSEIRKANVKAEIEMVKQNNVITLNFHLKGTVDVTCDRCAKEVGLPIDITDNVVVKHGNVEESTDEIVVLPHGETEIDVTHYLYEFIMLAIPPKRIPCEEDETVECDYDALDKLDNIALEEEKTEPNPLWDELKKLKFNNN